MDPAMGQGTGKINVHLAVFSSILAGSQGNTSAGISTPDWWVWQYQGFSSMMLILIPWCEPHRLHVIQSCLSNHFPGRHHFAQVHSTQGDLAMCVCGCGISFSLPTLPVFPPWPASWELEMAFGWKAPSQAVGIRSPQRSKYADWAQVRNKTEKLEKALASSNSQGEVSAMISGSHTQQKAGNCWQH